MTIGIISGGGGGNSISFEPSPAPFYSQVREIKMCEQCGRNFLRLIPLAGRGEVDCPPCVEEQARLKEIEKQEIARMAKA